MTDDDFPRSWPAHTTYIYLHEMNLQTIPPNAFEGLLYLNTIEFKQSNLGSLSPCAIKSIASLENLIFDQTVVGHLESFSIHNMTGPLTIDFKSSRVTKISPMALSDLDHISALNIIGSTVFEMETMSLSAISGNLLNITGSTFKKLFKKPTDLGEFTQVVMVKNKFDTLPCGTFDTVEEGRVVYVHVQNSVKCDCGIFYINKIKNVEVKQILGDMICLKDDNTDSGVTVSKALQSMGSCGTDLSTGCELPSTFRPPLLHCPVLEFVQGGYIEKPHSHGDSQDAGRNSRERQSSNVILIVSVILMGLIYFHL